MAAKKHSSRKKSGKSAKTGARLSGNPQVRAEQLQERASSYASSQRDSDWETTIPLAGRVPASAATGRDSWTRPAPWWPQSHERILDRVRTTSWPTDPLAVETLAGQIVGDELFMRASTPGVTGVYPFQWMAALVEAVSAALQDAVTAGPAEAAESATGWPELWAFLTGLWDRSIPGTLDKTTALLADQAATASPTHAIRHALEIAAHNKRQEDLRADAARLAANPEYQAEIRAVREELDELRAW